MSDFVSGSSRHSSQFPISDFPESWKRHENGIAIDGTSRRVKVDKL